MKPETIELLKQLAAREAIGDDVDSPPDFGGHVDDAYQCGADDGETYLARRILSLEQ